MQENLQNEELENKEAQSTENNGGEVSGEVTPTAEQTVAHAISDEDVMDVVFESEPIVAEESVAAPSESDEKEEEFFANEFDMESLQAKFNEWVESGEILNSRQNFRKIRDRFQVLWEELRNGAYEAYMASGGEKDYFEFKAESEIEIFSQMA